MCIRDSVIAAKKTMAHEEWFLPISAMASPFWIPSSLKSRWSFAISPASSP